MSRSRHPARRWTAAIALAVLVVATVAAVTHVHRADHAWSPACAACGLGAAPATPAAPAGVVAPLHVVRTQADGYAAPRKRAVPPGHPGGRAPPASGRRPT